MSRHNRFLVPSPAVARCRRFAILFSSCLILAAVLLCGWLGGVALAQSAKSGEQPSKRDHAAKLGAQAIDLYNAGDFAGALEKFDAADKLLPNHPSLKVRVARCLDKLNRLREAVRKYREAIAVELDPDAHNVEAQRQARDDAVAELAELLKQVPTVTVIVKEKDSNKCQVLLDQQPYPGGSLGQKTDIDPGNHAFKLSCPERGSSREDVAVGRADHQRIVLSVPEAPAPPSKPALKPAPLSSSPWPKLGWASIALGGAGLTVGIAAGVLVLTGESELLDRCPDRRCPPEAHDDARAFDTKRMISTVGLISGASIAALGGAFLIAAPSEEEEDAVQARLGLCTSTAAIMMGTCLSGSF